MFLADRWRRELLRLIEEQRDAPASAVEKLGTCPEPSGNPTPLAADRGVMEALKQQPAVMNMSFLDFIIAGEKRYWSMFEEADGGEYALGEYPLSAAQRGPKAASCTAWVSQIGSSTLNPWCSLPSKL